MTVQGSNVGRSRVKSLARRLEKTVYRRLFGAGLWPCAIGSAHEFAEDVVHGIAVTIGVEHLVEHAKWVALALAVLVAAQKAADHTHQATAGCLGLGGLHHAVDLVVGHLLLQP